MSYKIIETEFPKERIKMTDYLADTEAGRVVIQKINDDGKVFYKLEVYPEKYHQDCLIQTDNLDLLNAICNFYGIINPLTEKK